MRHLARTLMRNLVAARQHASAPREATMPSQRRFASIRFALTHVVSSVILLALTACGGSDGPSGTPGPNPSTVVSQLTTTAGGEQSGAAGTRLPTAITVRARNPQNGEVAGVMLQASANTGGSVQPAAVATNSDGVAEFQWTLGRAEGNQSLTITAASGGVTASVTATATRPVTAAITIAPSAPVLVSGDSVWLTATVLDSLYVPLVSRPVTWATSNGVITVSQTGLVTTNRVGTALVGATNEGVTKWITVVVQPAPVATVTVAPLAPTVVTGQTLSLQATVRDARQTLLFDRAATWSSATPSVATIDSRTGVVTGVNQGMSVITATSEGQRGTVTVTVIPPPLGEGFGDAQFAAIPAGSFQMGATNGSTHERPVHPIAISAFSMQRTEVTQGQWRAVMGTNPSFFNTCGDACPVENVSYTDVQLFLTRLREREPSKNYRLPTEAEWEYAARATTTGDYGGTGLLDQMGWYFENSSGGTHAVGRKIPNTFGLYDMHGNVWEWVNDWYSATYYSASPTVNPPGPVTGSYRIGRGGTWNSSAGGARSAHRAVFLPSDENSSTGFRLARTP